MKIIFIILSLIWFESFGQTAYSIFWTTNSEMGVRNYEVQQSIDTVNWNILTTVVAIKNKDSNKYSYQLPFVNAYIRLNANMEQGNFYTQPIYFIGVTVPSIFSATTGKGIYTDILTWNTLNEGSLVNYYSVEKSADSVNFSLVSNVTAKGDSKYTLTIYRFSGKKPVYRVKTFLKTGSYLPPIIFK